MAKTFVGKNQKLYPIEQLEITNVLSNSELLDMFSMNEFDQLYKQYFGYYEPMYKHILIAKIQVYDKSNSVNQFVWNGKTYWFDKDTRMGLMNLVNCSTIEVPIVLGNEIINFNPQVLKTFLEQLELYASKCFIQTKQHLLNVQDLSTTEEILNYDYTTGYPDKIILE